MNRARARRVTIQFATGRRGVPSAASLRRWATLALGASRGSIAIRIVDGTEAAALNRRYRDRSRATNVLSFPAAKLPDGSRPVLGDIVIAAPVVAREARMEGKDPRSHWAHLVVHGCLHLLGYDHGGAGEAAIMEMRERRLLRRLGFSDPYEAERR